ncbi:MFS transporter [Hoyosella altamirensis]|uniref:MFS family permease n=1 Tax=Hoyosella altamirensis TaxID=616997 RepID=A0A839RRD8_9ACTN|nr:MFS transporter [Hoyosella altamirensis]MBB3039090.1 MFS family permease [Hoyosella altamirensis]
MTYNRVPLALRSGTATFGVCVVGYMTANLIPLMIIVMVDELGMSSARAGTIMTMCLLACALTCLFVSRWATHASRYHLGRIGLVVMAIGFAGTAFSTTPVMATVFVIIGGVGSGGAVAVGGASLAAFINPNRVSSICGLVNRIVVTIVLALVPIVGLNMTNAFGIVAVLALAAAVTVTWLPMPPSASEESWETSSLKEVSSLSPRMMTVAGVTLLCCFALWAVGEDALWAVSGVMGQEQAALTDHQMGLALSLSTAGGIAAALALTVIGARFGRAIPVGVLLVAGGVLKLAATLSTSAIPYLAIIVAWNTLYVAAFIYIIAIAAGLDPSGRWSSSILGTYLIGSAFAPMFGTFLAETAGYQVLGVVLAAFSFVLLVPLVVIARLSTRVEKAHCEDRETQAFKAAPSDVLNAF